MAKKKRDEYEDFRALDKFGQMEHLLNIASMCIDGAPKSLARKIEIYLDSTPEEQNERRHRLYTVMDDVRAGRLSNDRG